MERDKKEREGFSTGLGVFFATLGSTVGLGNIWKFPYMVGDNGGGAFLLIYLLCVVFVALPIMISEFYIGRKTRKNVVGAIKELRPDQKGWRSIGVFGILSAYLIMFFYTCVAGWVYSYIFKAIKGDFAGVTSETANSIFGKTVVGPVPPILWQLVALVIVSVIIIAGVQKGIERVTKTLIPILFVLIIICAVRALTLPGAKEGLKFLFYADFSKITPAIILSALGLAFFKLSLGMGTMTTYGSYFTNDNNMIRTSIRVAISDIIVSLLAGLAIFPTVFTFEMEPGAGPGLLFQTIPLVFSKLPFGRVLLVVFFVLTAIAATTAMISMVEVLAAYYTEEKGMKRNVTVIISSTIIFAFGILATLSADKASVLGNVTIPLLNKGFFDTFDYISSNWLMPIGGLLIAVFVGHFNKYDDIRDELSNNGTLNNEKTINVYYFLVRYITPILLIAIFLNCLGIF